MSKKNESDTARNIVKMNPSQLSTTIEAMFDTHLSFFIWGPPGIGKSEVALQAADRLGVAFIDIRLSQMDPTDLRGIPFPTTIGGRDVVRWSTPYILPQDLDYSYVEVLEAEETRLHFANPQGKNKIHYCRDPQVSVRSLDPTAVAHITSMGPDHVVVSLKRDGQMVAGKVRVEIKGKVHAILALEEYNSAPNSVQAASYELVLDRRLGEYKVPDHVMIIAMGNRETDKGIVFKMATPIANRFDHIEMMHNFDDWQRWALTHDIHRDVVGFLSVFKNHLFNFDPSTASRGFATPRSWSFVSKILKKSENLPDDIVLPLITGAIGDSPGFEFNQHRQSAKTLPSAQSILTGKVKTMAERPANSLCFALATSLCYELRDEVEKAQKGDRSNWKNTEAGKAWYVMADHFIDFVMANFPIDISIMAVKTALKYHGIPFDTRINKSFKTFSEKHGKLIIEA